MSINPNARKLKAPDLLPQGIRAWGGRIPKRIRMLTTVTPDTIPGVPAYQIHDEWMAAVEGNEYPVEINRLGAVTALLPGGRKIGVKPDEFEVVESVSLAVEDTD